MDGGIGATAPVNMEEKIVVIRPSKTQRIVAGLAVAAAAGAGMATFAIGSASAATSTTVSITAVSPHLLPALTANQVITVTGKGFDQSTMTGVTITGTGACTTAPQFIVTSPTTLVLKTAADCAVGASTVTITDSSGTATNPTGTATALAFAAAPTLLTVDATHNAVTTDNTSGLAYADQATTVPVGGGSVIRVNAGATPFVNSTATPLTATLGGVALTAITMHTGGDYFTGKVGPHAAGAVALSVTSGGVTKSFATTTDNGFAYAGSTIALTPASGPANGGNTLSIAGTGFTASSTVTVGGVACTGVVATATKLTCVVPKIAAGKNSGAAPVVVTTGAAVTTLSATSVYIYLAS